MEFVIILNDKTKIPISRAERDQMLKNSAEGSQAFPLERTGDVISMRPFPNIVKAEYYKQEKGKYTKDGVLLSHGQYLPTAEELGFVPTAETERKRLAYEAMRTKFLEAKTIPRLTEIEQKEASDEERQRANS